MDDRGEAWRSRGEVDRRAVTRLLSIDDDEEQVAAGADTCARGNAQDHLILRVGRIARRGQRLDDVESVRDRAVAIERGQDAVFVPAKEQAVDGDVAGEVARAVVVEHAGRRAGHGREQTADEQIAPARTAGGREILAQGKRMLARGDDGAGAERGFDTHGHAIGTLRGDAEFGRAEAAAQIREMKIVADNLDFIADGKLPWGDRFQKWA